MKKIISGCFCAIMVLAAARGMVAAESENELLRESKVNRTHAERIALANAHGGTIKSGEIEREKGRLVWSFDIAKTGVAGITEVLLDAKTGQLISVERENATQEAAEAKAEAKGKKR